jgi:hypothetical protein
METLSESHDGERYEGCEQRHQKQSAFSGILSSTNEGVLYRCAILMTFKPFASFANFSGSIKTQLPIIEFRWYRDYEFADALFALSDNALNYSLLSVVFFTRVL